jgi:endonuclease/exonuclease/phosphatase family metal-dependent hydrolase
MKLATLYNHPKENLLLKFFRYFFDAFEPNTLGVLLGDLNANHTVFGSKTKTKNGHRLRRYLKDLGLVVLNPKKSTFTKGQSVLDFIICKASHQDNKFFRYCDVLVDDNLKSDHFPVQLDLCFTVDDRTVLSDDGLPRNEVA